MFAHKAGAVNLAVQLNRETTPAMREIVLSSLASFIKGNNFPGKIAYVTQAEGLQQLCTWLCLRGEQETEMCGQGPQLRKIRLKLLSLAYDLVLNDEGIDSKRREVIRSRLGQNDQFVGRLLEIIQDSDIKSNPESQVRENSLNILYRIYQVNRGLSETIEATLKPHVQKVKNAISELPEREEQLTEELQRVEDVLQAPSQQIVSNFEVTQTMTYPEIGELKYKEV